MSADDARQLIRDMTLIRELEVSTYSFNKADRPELMLAAAVNLGIDVNTMKKAIVGEAKKLAAEKAAKKAKAADKAKKKGPAQALLPEVEQPAETAPATAVDAPIGAASTDVRYRHPNSMMTWTGRGRAPKWVQEWIESGNTLDGLQVHATPAATNQAPAQVTQ